MSRAETSPPFAEADQQDVELLAHIAEGDRSAFERFFHLHASRVGGYLWKLLRSRELVDETLDDVMWIVWEKAGSFDGRARPVAWLFGIARNRALKTLGRLQRDRRHPLGDAADVADEEHATPDDPSLEKHLQDREALRALAAALPRLSPEHRSVLELTFFEGLSYKEIASLSRCPVGTVKTRMHHARRALLARMGEHLDDR